MEEGIVAGGGTALLYATNALRKLEVANFDQKHGVELMIQALTVPCKTIASNAGVEGAVRDHTPSLVREPAHCMDVLLPFARVFWLLRLC